MSPATRFYPQARQDLIQQAAYLAEEASLRVAERFLRQAERSIARLADNPRIGRRWQGLQAETRKGLRVWRVEGFPKILIFYRVEESGVAIVRILHGARDLPALLDEFV